MFAISTSATAAVSTSPRCEEGIPRLREEVSIPASRSSMRALAVLEQQGPRPLWVGRPAIDRQRRRTRARQRRRPRGRSRGLPQPEGRAARAARARLSPLGRPPSRARWRTGSGAPSARLDPPDGQHPTSRSNQPLRGVSRRGHRAGSARRRRRGAVGAGTHTPTHRPRMIGGLNGAEPGALEIMEALLELSAVVPPLIAATAPSQKVFPTTAASCRRPFSAGSNPSSRAAIIPWTDPGSSIGHQIVDRTIGRHAGELLRVQRIAAGPRQEGGLQICREQGAVQETSEQSRGLLLGQRSKRQRRCVELPRRPSPAGGRGGPALPCTGRGVGSREPSR